MRDWSEIDSKVMWLKNRPLNMYGIREAINNLPSGTQAHVVAGNNEDGWEHVSMELMARRLPTWDEMCYLKDLFWDDEETVIQMHPKKSHYVNMVEALHLWRPVDGDWNILNREDAT